MTNLVKRILTRVKSFAWLAIGLFAVLALLRFAYPNLKHIYEVETDFVLGLLFSVITYSFTRAFYQVDKNTLIESIAVLEQDAEAARQSLAKCYELLAAKERFIDYTAMLDVVYANILTVLEYAREARRVVKRGELLPSPPDPFYSSLLDAAGRDTRACVERLRQEHHQVNERFMSGNYDDAVPVFGTLISDVVQSGKSIEDTRYEFRTGGNWEVTAKLGLEYLRKAKARADGDWPTVFEDASKRKGSDLATGLPYIHSIVKGDIDSAIGHLCALFPSK